MGTTASPPRAIGQPLPAGAIPVWLTSFAVLPWSDRVEQAGRHTFTVSNRGAQKHSFAIVQFEGDPRALPLSSSLIDTARVTVVAQVDAIDPGRELDVTVDLPVGRYILTSLTGRDYADGMAAGFRVGGAPTGSVRPKPPTEGALGAYLTEYGAFVSNSQVRGGPTTITVQNLGTRTREFALIRWRGAEDALPTHDGLILLDGLQEVLRFESIGPGGERPISAELKGGFSYVLVSLTKGEYEQGIHAQVRVN